MFHSSFPASSARRISGLSGSLLMLGGALVVSTGFISPAAAKQANPANSPAPAIVPLNAPAPVPVAVPGTGVGLGTNATPTIDELSFEDIEVAQLLTLIAKQFGIQIAVASDVDGVIRSINLSNQTPEQALQTVVEIAGLNYKRKSNGTYLVSKAKLEATSSDSAPSIVDAAPFATPFGGLGAPTNSPFPAAALPNGYSGLGALNPAQNPGFGGNFGAPPSNLMQGLPELEGFNESRNNTQARPIRIRNVKASTIAYWLDPANHAVPLELQFSASQAERYGEQPLAKNALALDDRGMGTKALAFTPGAFSPSSNPYIAGRAAVRPDIMANAQFQGGGQGGRTGGAAGGGVFQLPEGIERLIAVDPQNLLLVQGGTDESIRRLQEIINVLDRPLRQVEIEAQFVTVSTSATDAFGIDFSTARNNVFANTNGFAPSSGSGSFSLGFVRGNFQATLTALIAQNRAKVLTAPRVTAINNLTANISSATATPIILNTVSNSDFNNNTAQSQNLIYITTTIGLTVTPTINNDDTITVLMQPQLQSQVPSGLQGNAAAPVISSQQVFTVANVRDGDTIALGGLRTKNIARGYSKVPLLGDIPIIGPLLFRTKNDSESESELIIFVSARIVRRAGFDDPIINN